MNMPLIKCTKAICPDEQGREEVWWEMTVTADTGWWPGNQKEFYNEWKCCPVSNDDHDSKGGEGKDKLR